MSTELIIAGIVLLLGLITYAVALHLPAILRDKREKAKNIESAVRADEQKGS